MCENNNREKTRGNRKKIVPLDDTKFIAKKVGNCEITKQSSESDSSSIAHSSSQFPSPRASMKIGYFVNNSTGEIIKPNVEISSNETFKCQYALNQPNISELTCEQKPTKIPVLKAKNSTLKESQHKKELKPTKIPVYTKIRKEPIFEENKFNTHKSKNYNLKKESIKNSQRKNDDIVDDSSGTNFSKIPKFLEPIFPQTEQKEEASKRKTRITKNQKFNMESEGWMTSLESRKDIAKDVTNQGTQTKTFPMLTYTNEAKLISSKSSSYELDSDYLLVQKYNNKTRSTQTLHTESFSSFTQTDDRVQGVSKQQVLLKQQENSSKSEFRNSDVILFGAYINYTNISRKFYSLFESTGKTFLQIMLTAVISFSLGAWLFCKPKVEKRNFRTNLLNMFS